MTTLDDILAILGLNVDHEYSPEMRHEYLEPFNAEVLFYPVGQDANGRPDHSALQVLLDSLPAQSVPAGPVPAEIGLATTGCPPHPVSPTGPAVC